MKWLYLFFCLSLALGLKGQTKEVSRAWSYYTTFVKENKVTDIEKAYELIVLAMKDSINGKSEEALFYNAVIIKQYFETKKIDHKAELVLTVAQSLVKSYRLNRNFKNKEQFLKLLQIIGYDLYAEGIKQHKNNQHTVAYQLYKELLEAQSILAENKLDFTIITNSGEKSTISSKDITNNMVVFCINSGKREEAKLLFENEVKVNPSPLSYARLIQLCYQLDDKTAANNYIREGLKKYPQDSDILVYSINSNLGDKNYEQAIKQLDEAIRLNPSTSLYLVKAQTLENQDRLDEAISIYRNALKLYPNDFDLNYGLGYVLLNRSFNVLNEQNEKTKPNALTTIKEAKECFTKAKQINPTKVDFEKIFEQINNVK